MTKNTILIVDDEALNINIIAQMLLDNYDVKVATNGKDALELIKKERIDLVLLDIMMPEMDGFEVANILKHDSTAVEIPIIFLTAKHDAQSIVEGFKSGASDYISKPFLKEELLVRVENHLQIKKLRKSLSDTMGELHLKVAELEVYKNHLEVKVEEEIAKREEKEKMLYQQSKLAAMGEMMDAIAHQWRQPVGIIKMRVDMIGYDYADNLINKKYIQEFQEKIFSHIEHIESTLKEFRSFFRPNKQSEEFDVKTMVDKVLLLVSDDLLGNQITVSVNVQNNFTLTGIENEFKHLLINLLNNAKDAFIDNNINDRKIQINLLSNEDSKSIEVIDNAGGIPESVIHDIFKANVTTKEENKGTGIGLYMSSQIAAKYNGTLSVENISNGAKFIFLQKIIS